MIAEKQRDVADQKAEQVSTDASAESEIMDVLLMRRSYDYMHKKLDVIDEASKNGGLKIYGNSNDNVITQMAAYNIVRK